MNLILDESFEVEDTQHDIRNKCKNKSKKCPLLKTNPTIWMFVQQVMREINNLDQKKGGISNLNRNKRKALRNLETNPNLVIKPSDKGGNIVLMDNERYERICLNILSNKEWYIQISSLLPEQFNDKFYTIIDRARNNGVITEEIWEFLRIPLPRMVTFYSITKTHKSVTNPPGQPIVSGVGNITSNASRLIDMYLQPHVTSLPSYTRDSIHLLQVIDDVTVSEGSYLVAIDVQSLYNLIPHDKGVATVVKKVGSSALLYWNDLTGGGGELVAEDSLPIYQSHIIMWQIYIDDILLIWDGPWDLLEMFLRALSNNTFNLSFTYQVSQEKITFLDLYIKIDPEGRLSSSLYRKPSAGNTILHFYSFHPFSLKNLIPYSHYLLVR